MAKKLSSLPVGALIKDTGTTYNGAPIVWRILEHGHSGDPAGTTALEARDIICLKAFDAKESNNSDSNRKSYGNNRYKYSNLLQWLNSDKAAGAWYSAQHSTDAPPASANVWQSSNTAINPYDTEKGFLANFSANLKAALQTVGKTTALNTVTDGGGSETVSSKVFLLSNTEVGLTNENNIAEGSIYAYYSQSNTNDRRKKNLASDAAKGNYSGATSPWHWWLRSPHSGHSCNARIVNTDGTLHYHYAFRGHIGVAPAYVVLSSLLVSDSTDSDGCYTILWNAAPEVTPASQDFGSVAVAPSITINVNDADGDSYTGVVRVDNVQKATFAGTGSGTHALDMAVLYSAMSIGQHTITVTVTDSYNNATTVTYLLTKTNSAPAAPTTALASGMRRAADFYIVFQPGTDGDGDTQTVKAQVSADDTFASVTEFSGMEKLVNGEWQAVNSLTNADTGTNCRVRVTGQTVGTQIYVRLAATDAGSGSTSYTSGVMVKIGDTIDITMKPAERDEMPQIAKVITKAVLSSGASMKLYATNNALDDSPVWQECVDGEAVQFTNTTKTADKWAVSARAVITAGDATGEVSISAIGMGVL